MCVALEQVCMASIEIKKIEQDGEQPIDLVSIIWILWRGKLTIILFSVIFSIAALIYAFTAKEKWTSTAEVIAPRIKELSSYLDARKEYSLISEEELNVGTLIDGLHAKFSRLLYSLDEREQFFLQSEEYKRLVKDGDDKTKRKILESLIVKDISILKPDAKKNPDMIGKRISFTAETADISQQVLREFIHYIDEKAFQIELNEFLIWLNQRIVSLEYEKSQIEGGLIIQKSVQIENLVKALDIAKAAGIKEYATLLSNEGAAISNIVAGDAKITLSESKLSDGTYLFMLGEKYLKAHIRPKNVSTSIFRCA